MSELQAQSFATRLDRLRLAPLWDRIARLLPAEPHAQAVPHIWRYREIRPTLLETADVIGAAQAERRVLILENPALPGDSAVTDDLFAGLQLIMPGEIAPAHRHTPSALRFILESDRAYTTVDGERVEMRPGDLVLTPAWRWHGHGHEGDEPVVWLDVLDLPLVRALGARFAERDAPTAHEPGTAGAPRFTEVAFGHNMAPVERTPGRSMLRYEYASSLGALRRFSETVDADRCHGYRLEYIDPSSGGSVLPTISAYLQLLPAGFESTQYQSTAGTIFCVASGRGTLELCGDAGESIRFEANDVLAVPCWQPHRFAAEEETVLFSASDRAAQAHLGLWRERRDEHQ